MSRLYIQAETDAIKNKKTARAHKYIRVLLHYDNKDREKHITIECRPDGDSGMVCDVMDTEGNKCGEIKVLQNHKVVLHNTTH